MDRCELCGFDFDEIELDQIGPRSSAGVLSIVSLSASPPRSLRASPPGSGHDAERRSLPPGRWTTVEYVAHVRDVLLTIRDRLVIGLVEDNPGFKPLYREERIDLGLYRSDTPEAVAAELEAALAMFLRLFASIDRPLLNRKVQYGFPGPVERSLLWLGKQAVHEVEHHLADCRDNATMAVSSARS